MDKKQKRGIAVFIAVSVALISATVAGLIVNKDKIASDNDRELAQILNGEQQVVELYEGNKITPGEVSLNEYDNDVMINEGGTYKLFGDFQHTIIVKAGKNDEVRIVLDEANIASSETAAIVALSGKSLTIAATEGTENRLMDDGASQYNAVVYSKIPVILSGNGAVTVVGTQKNGNGIAVVDGGGLMIDSGSFAISAQNDGLYNKSSSVVTNGGKLYIVAGGDGIDAKGVVMFSGTGFILGSADAHSTGINDRSDDGDSGAMFNGGSFVAVGAGEMREANGVANHGAITVDFKEAQKTGTMITLVRGEEAVISFTPSKPFRYASLATDGISAGEYEFYTGGEVTGAKSLEIGDAAKLEYGVYVGGKYNAGSTGKKVIDKFKLSGNSIKL